MTSLRPVALVVLAAMTQAMNAAAQALPPPAATTATPPPPESTPPAPQTSPPAAHPEAPSAPEPEPTQPPPAPETGGPQESTPPPPPHWYDGFAVDGFVDAYASYNGNTPQPQAPVSLYPTSATSLAPASVGGSYSNPPGGTGYRAFDVAQGFAVNWLGVNAVYSSGVIGGTIGLRFGPGAIIYHAGSSDETAGLQFVKQAYATWKPADKLTIDLGKWDQPFGSEVADSQLNMNYTRSVLFWYMQPLWFTGLRMDYVASDALELKAFVANGWNNTLAINRGKSFGAQAVLTAAKEAAFYLGWVGGPQQQDFTYAPPPAASGAMPGAPVPGDVPTASHWRSMFDVVADLNPTSNFRFLLNADYRMESALPDAGGGTHDAVVYGANAVLKCAFTDAFYTAVRGEYYHDEHGDTLGTGAPTDVEDGTITLVYGIGSHLSLMLDGRYDHANVAMFQKNTTDSTQDQLTATLGVIASTK